MAMLVFVRCWGYLHMNVCLLSSGNTTAAISRPIYLLFSNLPFYSPCLRLGLMIAAACVTHRRM